MQGPDSEASRVETVTAALLYLMTQYARTGCPCLARCIARHMQCLATHPHTARVMRDMCASLHGAWSARVTGSEQTGEQLH